MGSSVCSSVSPPFDTMVQAWDFQNLPMPVFLLASCIANAAFLWVSIRRLVRVPQSVLSRALAAQAIAELCWTVPCFLQCAVVYAKGSESAWFQGYGDDSFGCKIMGFYSVFSLVAGMGTTVIMALVTERTVMEKPLPGLTPTTIVILALFALALLYACLPLMGMHRYTFGHPICYYDWYDVSHSTLILLWTVPALIAGMILFARAALKRRVFVLHFCTFSFCWALWIPAAVIGLADIEMPTNYILAGAVLGHGQALVDPLLYGLVWNSAIPETDAYEAKKPESPKVSPELDKDEVKDFNLP